MRRRRRAACGPPFLLCACVSEYLAHTVQPALVLAPAQGEVVGYPRVRKDEEALVVNALDYHFRDLLGLEQAFGEQRLRADRILLDRVLDHRRAHPLGAQAGDLDPLVAI